jgi:energy-coupling factor transport system ATP-binding protein
LGLQYVGEPGPALSGIDLDLGPGASLLVVGPSGAGKSSLLRAIAGLSGPEHGSEVQGRILVDEAVATAPGATGVAERVGILFQDPASQLVMDRVEDDVAFGLENRGWAAERMHGRVPGALAVVGLTGFERRRSVRLSGGEQQRVALAGVLAPVPGLLLLDEPTASLDPAAARQLAVQVGALKAGRQATVVLVDHQVDLWWPLVDLVVALDRSGRMIDLGPPEAVLERSGARMGEEGIWLPGAQTTVAGRPAEAASGPALLDARDVRFAYDAAGEAVAGVDLRVAEGEAVALVGANGSGKTTLARLCAGLLRPAAGELRLGGAAPHRLPARRLARLAGYAFQDPEQGFLRATVEDEVGVGLDPRESAGVAVLMEELGLPLARFGSRSPYTLSGGEQRRLSLAPILARSPRLLVLDEPTFGQDRRNYQALVELLRRRTGEGTALIAATHDERLVRELFPRALELDGGRVGRAH